MLLEDYLRFTVDKGASDLHLKAGGPAYVRVHGDLSEIVDLPVLTPADTERFVRQALDDTAWERFAGGNEADAAYSVPAWGASAWPPSASAARPAWSSGWSRRTRRRWTT